MGLQFWHIRTSARLQDKRVRDPCQAGPSTRASLKMRRQASTEERRSAWQGVEDALKGWDFPRQEHDRPHSQMPEDIPERGPPAVEILSTRKQSGSQAPLAMSHRTSSQGLGEGYAEVSCSL